MDIVAIVQTTIGSIWSCLFRRSQRPVRHYHPFPFDP
jgi:hypothetical protein